MNHLTRSRVITLLCCLLLAGCSTAPVGPTTATPTPTTGTISGTILDSDGKSLVGILDEGWVALYCPDDNMKAACLHEDYVDIDASVLISSICRLGDLEAKNCLLHYPIGGAAQIAPNGSYTLYDIPPGQYELVLIIVSSGIALTIHLMDVDPVQAGQVTTYNFQTK